MNNEYPRARFHATFGERLVLTPDADAALEPGWYDSIEEARAAEPVVDLRGPQGEPGPAGPTGATGATGRKGEAGEQGATGKTGRKASQ